jgi:hypothetical protein
MALALASWHMILFSRDFPQEKRVGRAALFVLNFSPEHFQLILECKPSCNLKIAELNQQKYSLHLDFQGKRFKLIKISFPWLLFLTLVI